MSSAEQFWSPIAVGHVQYGGGQSLSAIRIKSHSSLSRLRCRLSSIKAGSWAYLAMSVIIIEVECTWKAQLSRWKLAASPGRRWTMSITMPLHCFPYSFERHSLLRIDAGAFVAWKSKVFAFSSSENLSSLKRGLPTYQSTNHPVRPIIFVLLVDGRIPRLAKLRLVGWTQCGEQIPWLLLLVASKCLLETRVGIDLLLMNLACASGPFGSLVWYSEAFSTRFHIRSMEYAKLRLQFVP